MRWHVQFIFLDESGEARMTHQVIEAPDRDAASAMATELAPAQDCVFNLQEESDEQFLGSVRSSAMSHAGRNWDPDRDFQGLLLPDDDES